MAEFDLIQTRRDEFHDYLEKGEVFQTFARILSELFEEEEKPSNPLRYVKEKLAVPSVSPNEIQALKHEIDHAIEEMNILYTENESLKDEISHLSSKFSNNNNTDDEQAAVDGNEHY